MAHLRLEGIRKVFPGHEAVRRLDLDVADGELVVLVGPSGCGKSTLLRIVAGLESPTEGGVHIGGHDVTHWTPRARDVAMVFQSYALYPHKSVRDNLGFGLQMRSVEPAEIARRTREVAERLSLQDLLDRRPAQLSGGQRQRVALGRALVRQPQVFLMDEPLSNLDAKLRLEMRAEIGRLHGTFGVTTLYVTHDQEEAMTLGERIAVLSQHGRIEQLAPPLEVYRRPASRFVADFIGMPAINWFCGRVAAGEGRRRFRNQDLCVDLPEDAGVDPERQVLLGIRPHDLALGAPAASPLRCQVELIEALGSALLLHGRTAGGDEVRAVVAADAAVARGEVVGLAPDPAHLLLFDPDTGLRA